MSGRNYRVGRCSSTLENIFLLFLKLCVDCLELFLQLMSGFHGSHNLLVDNLDLVLENLVGRLYRLLSHLLAFQEVLFLLVVDFVPAIHDYLLGHFVDVQVRISQFSFQGAQSNRQRVDFIFVLGRLLSKGF